MSGIDTSANMSVTATAAAPVAAPMVIDPNHLPAELNWLLLPGWVEGGENLVITGSFGKSVLARLIGRAMRDAGKAVHNVHMTVHTGKIVKHYFDTAKQQMVADRSLLDTDLLIIYTLADDRADLDRSNEYLTERTLLGKSTVLIVDTDNENSATVATRFGAQLAECPWHAVHVSVPETQG